MTTSFRFIVPLLITSLMVAESPFTLNQKNIKACKEKLKKEIVVHECLEYAPYAALALGAVYMGYKMWNHSTTPTLTLYRSAHAHFTTVDQENLQKYVTFQKASQLSGSFPYIHWPLIKHIGNGLIKTGIQHFLWTYAVTGVGMKYVHKWWFREQDVLWFIQSRTNLLQTVAFIQQHIAGEVQGWSVTAQPEFNDARYTIMKKAFASLIRQFEQTYAYIDVAVEHAQNAVLDQDEQDEAKVQKSGIDHTAVVDYITNHVVEALKKNHDIVAELGVSRDPFKIIQLSSALEGLNNEITKMIECFQGYLQTIS